MPLTLSPHMVIFKMPRKLINLIKRLVAFRAGKFFIQFFAVRRVLIYTLEGLYLRLSGQNRPIVR